VFVSEAVDGQMHRQTGIELAAGTVPTSTLQQISQQVAVLILDMVFRQKDVCEPIHVEIIEDFSMGGRD
jgi:hypothetical protein